MKRAIPWILATFFACLLAISLLTRRSVDEPSMDSPEQTRDVSPPPETPDPAEIPPAAPDKAPKADEISETPREVERFTFKPGRSVREQIRDELRNQYIDGTPSMKAAIGERLGESIPVLLEILKDPVWRATGRLRAAHLLLEHRAPGIKEILESLLEDKAVRNYMVRFLSEHGDPTSARRMFEIYDQSDGMEKDSIIRAMAFLGYADGTRLVDKALKGHAEDIPAFLADAQKAEVPLEDIVHSIESDRKELEFYRRAIIASASSDPVTSAIPALYDERHYAREWGLHILARERPPTLALHLRAAMDVQKTRPRHRRIIYDEHFEWKLLRLLKEAGGALTRSEDEYLQGFGKGGSSVPAPPE